MTESSIDDCNDAMLPVVVVDGMIVVAVHSMIVGAVGVMMMVSQTIMYYIFFFFLAKKTKPQLIERKKRDDKDDIDATIMTRRIIWRRTMVPIGGVGLHYY